MRKVIWVLMVSLALAGGSAWGQKAPKAKAVPVVNQVSNGANSPNVNGVNGPVSVQPAATQAQGAPAETAEQQEIKRQADVVNARLETLATKLGALTEFKQYLELQQLYGQLVQRYQLLAQAPAAKPGKTDAAAGSPAPSAADAAGKK